MDISIIILTWNSEKYIEKCLQSIINDIYSFDYSVEIFIVDNGSIDTTNKIINDFKILYSNIIKPIFLKENVGTTISRNIALKKSTGEYICILDSDVEIPIGTFQILIDEYNKIDKIGLIAPKIVYPNGKFQKSTDVFPTIFTKFFRFFFLKLIENKNNNVINRQASVDYAISAMWLFNKKIIKTVGYLDENIFYAPEDVDYCLRIWKKGLSVIYCPFVTVTHHTQEISRGFKFNAAFYNHLKGLMYFFKKHNYVFKSPSFINYHDKINRE